MVETPAKSADTLTVGMLAQRLDGMDRAIELLQATMDKMPTPALVQADVNALKGLTESNREADLKLVDERFKGVDKVFEERKTGVETAFKAQNDSAAKTEKSLGDLIKQTSETVTTETRGLLREVGDVRVRMTAVESRTSVTREVTGDGRASIFAIIGAIVGIIGGVGGAMAIGAMFRAAGAG